MPLPSVEAASREGAIAAAREKYGSSVRIVGIRRIRTGGVMGFFTTERFVAEVEEIAPRPVVERRPASKAESMARIEAALRRDPVLPDPVDEVADLLGGGGDGQPSVGLYSRTSAPRTARPAAPRGSRTTPAAAPAAPPAPAAAPAPAPAAPVVDDAPLPPSPFTAALAQMVARDLEVREAVDEAIAAAAPAPARAAAPMAPPAAPVAAPAPAAAAPVAAPDPAPVAAPAAAVDLDDEDDDAGLDILWGSAPAPTPAPRPAAAVPPAPVPAPAPEPVAAALPPVPVPVRVPAPQAESVPVPEWVHEPDFSTGPITSREEAIAEVLRAALAHDTSDAALTQLLRGVLAGSPAEHDAAADDDAWAEADPCAHTAEIPVWVDATAEADEWEVEAEVLAPTASDPAPLPLPADATTILPPLSLLPPPAPGTALAVPPLLGRPPVPPAIGRAPGQSVARVSAPSADSRLATVTRLPVDKRAAAWRRSAPMVVPSVRGRSTSGGTSGGPVAGAAEDALILQLLELGVPERLLGEDFAVEVARLGAYAALTRALAAGLPAAPALPSGAGEVLLVVGPGVETLAAARSLAASMRLDGEQLQWASRGDLAALAPRSNRITSIDTALERKQEADRSSALTIVAVDVPLRAGGGAWLEQMVAVFAPAGVWAVVEATRKPEDVGPWLDALPRVDALMVQDTDLTADPAAVLSRTSTPVALLDGARATAHRWASLLCERLESSGA